MDQRLAEVKSEGQAGMSIDFIDAMKFVVICIVVGITQMVAAFSLGDVASKLITWFDSYAATNTKNDATNKKTGDATPEGTAAKHDIVYHYITLFGYYSLFTVIAVGGHWFGQHITPFNVDFECDFTAVDAATKTEVLDLWNSIKTPEQCY